MLSLLTAPHKGADYSLIVAIILDAVHFFNRNFQKNAGQFHANAQKRRLSHSHSVRQLVADILHKSLYSILYIFTKFPFGFLLTFFRPAVYNCSELEKIQHHKKEAFL